MLSLSIISPLWLFGGSSSGFVFFFHACMHAKHRLSFACLFFCANSAPTRPQLNSNFGSDVTYQIQVGNRPVRKFAGQWYNDLIGKRERFDINDRLGDFDIWRFWDSNSGGSEYEYNVKVKHCEKRDFTHRHMHLDVFGWVKNAVQNGTCGVGGALWSVSNGAFEFDLCASQDGKKPYWIDRLHLVEQRLHITATFTSFAEGRPSSSNFTLPAACPAHSLEPNSKLE